MSTWYLGGLVRLLDGTFDLDGDTIRMALLSDNTAYSPSADSETFVSDVIDGGTTATEFTGTGYSRQTLANTTVQQDTAASPSEAQLDADDVTFTNLDGDTIQSALIYVQVGGDDTTPGDDPLIAHYTSSDFPQSTNGGDIAIQFTADGTVALTL